MITRVRINGYKSLTNVDIQLRPLTVVIGPNASGKSNLLDALGLLSRMVTSATIDDAFDEHRGNPLEAFFVPPGGLDEQMSRDALTFTISVEVELSEAAVNAVEKLVKDMREGLPASSHKRVVERRMRYDLTIEFRTSTGMLRVRDERLVALRKDGEERKSRNPFIEKVGDRLHLRMEGQAHPIYHELGLDHTVVSTPLYAPHYPHITALREELSRWRFYYFDPAVMRMESPLREVVTLGHQGRDLAGYYHNLRIRNPRQFENMSLTLRMLVPAAEGVNTAVTPEGLVRLSLDQNGTTYSSHVISDGTLRVLGMLAMLAPGGPSTTIGFEEPENGVHPRRLQLVARLVDNAARQAGKQLIVTTHSAKLPDYLNHPSYTHSDYKSDVLLAGCRQQGGQTRFEAIDYNLLFGEQVSERALADVLERGDLGG